MQEVTGSNPVPPTMKKNLVKIQLPDGSYKEYPRGIKPIDLLDSNLSKKAVAVRLNGQLRDLTAPIESDSSLEFLTCDDPEGMSVFWHSASHVMAQAVKELFPEAKLGVGPAVEGGFYYDFDLKRNLTPEDLTRIEKKMREIISADYAFERQELTKAEAVKLFEELGENYKLELIQELDEEVTVYRQGDFVDLCRGPHLPSTGRIKHFKLLSVAGAYWRGEESNPMLQRIYGTAYPKQEDLERHLKRLEEAKKRDHRRLGRDLDLFNITDEIGAGLVLWHPKGALVRKIIEDFWREQHLKAGYELVYTPHIAKSTLWQTSGHWDFYREHMYAPMRIDNVEYELKPMNCPFHMMIYKSSLRSYRDLPIRWAELGTVYRYERSGVLHGLLRVRGFTQDDAHIFCRPDQLQEEVLRLLDFTLFILNSFGFERFETFLSTRPEKYVGDEDSWDRSTEALRKALESKGLSYQIDPGAGVFYGPKIDVKIRDVLDRSWQCTTIQIDFNLPQRFQLSYIGEDGKPHQPIVIHRALLGSLERFFGILIEHYGGAFPLWLAPIQVIVIPVSEDHHDYAHQIARELEEEGLRVKVDDRSEKVGYKVREAETQKIPYMLILGDREKAKGTISVRKRREGDLGEKDVQEFIQELKEKIVNRSIE